MRMLKQNFRFFFTFAKTDIGGLDSAWADKDGAELKTRFTEMITASREVCTKMTSLQSDLLTEIGRYNEIYQTAMRLMGAGGGN